MTEADILPITPIQTLIALAVAAVFWAVVPGNAGGLGPSTEQSREAASGGPDGLTVTQPTPDVYALQGHSLADVLWLSDVINNKSDSSSVNANTAGNSSAASSMRYGLNYY